MNTNAYECLKSEVDRDGVWAVVDPEFLTSALLLTALTVENSPIPFSHGKGVRRAHVFKNSTSNSHVWVVQVGSGYRLANDFEHVMLERRFGREPDWASEFWTAVENGEVCVTCGCTATLTTDGCGAQCCACHS